MNGEIEIYDGKKLSYVFEEVNGEVYLELGLDNVRYHLQVPAYNSPMKETHKSFTKELILAEVAQAVFESAHVHYKHFNRDGTASHEPMHFLNVLTQVHLKEGADTGAQAGFYSLRANHTDQPKAQAA